MENVMRNERPNEENLYAIIVDEETFDEAHTEDLGWCPSCEAFTTGVAGALAAGCRCVDCDDDRVCGAVHACRAGFITVEGDA